MKRVYIAIGVFALCIALSIFSYICITQHCKTLIVTSTAIESFSEKGNTEEVKKESSFLQQLWKQYSLPFSLLTTHVHYDALEESIDKVIHACEHADKKEIRNSCEDLRFEAKHIIQTINPTWENVF